MSGATSTSPASFAVADANSTTVPSIPGSKLEQFCDTPFWDPAISWWTSIPDITPCFQYTIVRLLPCYIFWLMIPFKLLRYRSDRLKRDGVPPRKCAYSLLTICKLAACGVLALVSLGELVQSLALYASQVTYRPTSQFLSVSVELVTIVWVAIVIRYERRYGYLAGGAIWLYWLLAMLSYVLVAYSAILNFIRLNPPASEPADVSSYANTTVKSAPSVAALGNIASRWNVDVCLLVLALLRQLTNIVSFLMACFADHVVDPVLLHDDKLAAEFGDRASPEMAAGFLSRLVYEWMFPIVRRGAKKSLVAADLCSLNPIDRSSTNTPRFELKYYTAVAAWRAKQSALGASGENCGDAAKKVEHTNGNGAEKSKVDAVTNQNPRLELVMHDDETDADQPLVGAKSEGQSAADEATASPTATDGSKKRYAVANEGSPSRGGRFRPFARRGKQKKEAEEKKPGEPKQQKSEFELDKTKYPSSLRALLSVYWKDIARAHSFKVIQDVVIFTNTALIGLLIGFADDPERFNYAWKGALFAFGLAANQLIQSLSFQRTFHIGLRCGMHMRTAITTALYRKALTVSNSARAKATLGELVNLMAVDAQRLQDFIGYSWAYWSCPVQIIVACVLIWTQMGVATLAGLGTMILVVLPANICVTSRQRKLQAAQMRYKDERIKQVNELLAGIRLVKLYAWEVPFRRRVSNTRDKEISVLRRAAYLGVVQSFIFIFAPYLVTVVTFAVFVATSEFELTAQRAFVTLNLFQILRFPMGILPMIIQLGVVSVVSVKRISRFLAQPDLNDANVMHELNEAEPITLDSASFGWSQQAVLRDVTLHVRRGELMAIVGRVGAGKSSLMSAILGETELLGGRVNVSGSVAYVAQQSWIQNASLRDNVLFGAPFDEGKYRRVLAACALESDLAMLPGGDQTEIGEKGINLSGGQKQRVALARALYANADVYLLDDPLSAVDVHVGRHIFDQVIGPQGLLRGKTRVFVTHGLHWLRNCDRVAVVDPTSKTIVQLGPYDELISMPDSYILNNLHLESDREAAAEASAAAADGTGTASTLPAQAVENAAERRKRTETERSERSTTVDSTSPTKTSATPTRLVALQTQKSMTREEEQEVIRAAIKKQEEQKLIQEEKNATGRVKLRVYLMYFRAQSLLLFVAYGSLQALYYGLFILANWWVSVWTEDQRLVGDSAASNCSLFNASTPLTASGLWPDTTTAVSLSSVTSPFATTSACPSKAERDDLRGFYLLIYGVIGIAIAIVTLIASILNAVGTVRASRVLHAQMLERILHAPMSFFDTTPIGRIVNRFSKDIDLVDNALPFTFRSWLQTLFGVFFTVIGVCVGTPLALTVVIPAGAVFYVVQHFFIPTTRQLKRLESTSKSPVFTHFSESLQGRATIRAFDARERFVTESERRTDCNNVYVLLGLVANRWIGIFLDFISTLFVAGASTFCVVASLNSATTGGRVGLSLTYALTIAQTLNWMVRMNNELETNIVSVERIQEYAEVEQEAQWERSESDLTHDGVKLTPEWPSQGDIHFDLYSTRYREHLDLVLRDVNVRVQAGEKVGIVGRTGAGKSSFTLALFRMIESVSGRIVIDGIDVGKLGVHQLRSKLTILPQDPVIFAGTLRSNLDPFDTYTDEQVWRSLELSGLREHFADNVGLNYECAEGGSNLSVGQRQLVCLARALLRKTKVLILDEATAAVDLRTDEFIQRTIRTAFSDCTVMTIAHRLNTIMDYDRILVLDRGSVVEFDSPAALLARPGSVFADMVRQANTLH